MGLHVHNLGNLPADAEREYFIYMLDYGWHEPLSEAMRANFTNMARLASKSKSVVIAGVEPIHFENEVFSFHGINGEHGEEMLPALMITTLHPRYFKENNHAWRESGELDDKLLLIPLKKCCKTTSDVVALIHKIFKDIEEKKELTNFSVQKEIKKKSGWRSAADAFILQPNISGIGIDFKKLLGFGS
ncbi:hypothetical protein PUND_a2416 [Pseudoalteromonas undina]|uniref:Uncharacterized protein n=1 Tax=Pseudoalteromonas undina TaxID=43660 RepID=A0ABN0NL13_9GAMM|nr:hypothetical protein [Pseudoalteromonas undina]KAF7766566.1 hypothetical protein PUND_a2416 [Pseudoalteromonas undina]